MIKSRPSLVSVKSGIRKKRWSVLVAGMAAASLALTGCAGNADQADSGDSGGEGSGSNYRVAMIADLTGAGAASNGTAAEGFRAAIEAANRDGGVNGRQIDLSTYDSESTPETTQIAARSAVTDEPSAIAFAALSSGLVASQNVFGQAATPVLSVSAAEELLLPEPQSWYYAGASTPSQIADSMTEVLRRELGELNGAKVAFHGLDSSTTNAIFNHLQGIMDDEGVEVVAFEKSNGQITSYTAQAQKIVSLGAEAVFSIDITDAFVLVGQALKDAGFEGLYLGTEGAAADSTFERLGDVNYVGGRAFQSVSGGVVADAAAAIGADSGGPYFSAGWALGSLIIEGLASCEADCSGEQMQEALNGLGQFTPAGDVVFGPLSMSQDRHHLIGVHQYFTWDADAGAVVAFGAPIPV